MKEGSHISAGSCLGKVFLLLTNWENREIEQPGSHSLTLGPPFVLWAKLVPSCPSFPTPHGHDSQHRKERAKPLCAAC